jgi:hypothetical protein
MGSSASLVTARQPEFTESMNIAKKTVFEIKSLDQMEDSGRKKVLMPPLGIENIAVNNLGRQSSFKFQEDPFSFQVMGAVRETEKNIEKDREVTRLIRCYSLMFFKL